MKRSYDITGYYIIKARIESSYRSTAGRISNVNYESSNMMDINKMSLRSFANAPVKII